MIEYPYQGEGMSDQAQSRETAELLKAFSHPTRLAILEQLQDGPKCVTDMEELLPARQANISQHLAVLRHAKLVNYAQDGALRCYYLCRPNLVQSLHALLERKEQVITRTSEQIKADKERLAKAMKSEQPSKKSSAKHSRRTGAPR
jgi:ArsR family transcriptional regulator